MSHTIDIIVYIVSTCKDWLGSTHKGEWDIDYLLWRFLGPSFIVQIVSTCRNWLDSILMLIISFELLGNFLDVELFGLLLVSLWFGYLVGKECKKLLRQVKNSGSNLGLALLLLFLVGFYQWGFCKYPFEPHFSRMKPKL